MSAALTQFMKKKIYEEQLANFLDGEEYVLEDQPIEKTDKVMEALKAATTHDYEVYSFAKNYFQMKAIWWLYYVQFYVKTNI